MNKTLSEIAHLVDGTLCGNGDTLVTGLSGIKEAQAGDLTFFSDPRYQRYLDTTPAAAILVPSDFPENGRDLIRVTNPYLAFAQVLKHRESEVLIHPQGIHATAAIDPSATLGENVAVGAHACVDANAVIGDNVVLYPGVYVGRDSTIGPDTIIYPNVTIRERVSIGARCILHANTAIGSDGFGYTNLGATHLKIPQIGAVSIGDDVEIGSNTAIDRSTVGCTTIGRGTKIDNLVQIAHNVSIGEDCTISGSTGISGSVTIGNNVVIGGQAGINGHLEIGDNVMIAGRTGVSRSVPSGSIVSGMPHNEHSLTRRIFAALPYLPELLRRFRRLEKRVDRLEH